MRCLKWNEKKDDPAYLEAIQAAVDRRLQEFHDMYSILTSRHLKKSKGILKKTCVLHVQKINKTFKNLQS